MEIMVFDQVCLHISHYFYDNAKYIRYYVFLIKTWYQMNSELSNVFLTVRYVKHLICIFMNINVNMRNQRKMQKNKGYTYKITYILAAN